MTSDTDDNRGYASAGYDYLFGQADRNQGRAASMARKRGSACSSLKPT
jgi:hypothetical protein